MKAFVAGKYKKKGALRLTEIPEPELRDDDVLVRVHAAGVNLLDSKIRDGEFKLILPYRPPFVLGHDVAGTIVRAGQKVRRFKAGDEVYARPRDHRAGTFAEFIAMNEADVALKPKNLSMEEAASIPLVGLTAWQALVEAGKVKPGQKVFIQAGSGGVGTFAIQLAKHLGATVATTTSTKNVDLVKSLGADVVIDYKTQDFEKVLSGYDFVLNSQDPKTLEKSLRVLKPSGQLISISGPPDPAFASTLAGSKAAPWRPASLHLTRGRRSAHLSQRGDVADRWPAPRRGSNSLACGHSKDASDYRSARGPGDPAILAEFLGDDHSEHHPAPRDCRHLCHSL
jgi:NADPH:quinone reductase-like Zn-dependent oxidoreductase